MQHKSPVQIALQWLRNAWHKLSCLLGGSTHGINNDIDPTIRRQRERRELRRQDLVYEWIGTFPQTARCTHLVVAYRMSEKTRHLQPSSRENIGVPAAVLGKEPRDSYRQFGEELYYSKPRYGFKISAIAATYPIRRVDVVNIPFYLFRSELDNDFIVEHLARFIVRHIELMAEEIPTGNVFEVDGIGISAERILTTNTAFSKMYFHTLILLWLAKEIDVDNIRDYNKPPTKIKLTYNS